MDGVRFKCILLVDDDRGDRLTIKRALGRLACANAAAIHEAESAESALEMLQVLSFDLILLDHHLPGMSGMESIKEIREITPFAPIIYITGQGDEFLAAKAVSDGVDEYLPKQQLTVESIEHAIQNAVEKSFLKKQLREHSLDLEQVAYILNHDLTPPLHRISTLTDSLAEKLGGEANAEANAQCQQLKKDALGAMRLIAMLGDIIRSPVSEFDAEDVDLNRAVDDAAQLVQVSSGILNGRVSREELPKIKANATLLRQILQSVIGNALTHNISSAPAVHVSAAKEESACKIRFKDNGVGMASNDSGKGSGRNVRLKTEGQPRGAKTGLVIAQANATRIGGSLELLSSDASGSTFELSLPLNADSEDVQMLAAKKSNIEPASP